MFRKLKKINEKLNNLGRKIEGPISIVFILVVSLALIILVIKTKNFQYFPSQTLNTLIYISISLLTIVFFASLIEKTAIFANLNPFLSAKELDSLSKEKIALSKKLNRKNLKELYKKNALTDKHLVLFGNWIEFLFFSIFILPIYASPFWAFKKPFQVLPYLIKYELSRNKKKIKIQLWAYKEKNETMYSIGTNA